MKSQKTSSGNLIFWFWIITGVWFLVGAYLAYRSIFSSEACTLAACVGPETWGSFLSGIFAPIAFFWLMAAVLIQSQELREQRAELALTRQEFTLNRKVMEEQAFEAKRQAEYIELQSRIMSEQFNVFSKNKTSDEFIELIDLFINYARESNELYFMTKEDQHIKIVDVNESRSHMSRESKIRLHKIAADTACECAYAFGFREMNVKVFRDLFRIIYSAEELVEKLPYPKRLSWRQSELSELMEIYCRLVCDFFKDDDLVPYIEARKSRLARDANGTGASE